MMADDDDLCSFCSKNKVLPSKLHCFRYQCKEMSKKKRFLECAWEQRLVKQSRRLDNVTVMSEESDDDSSQGSEVECNEDCCNGHSSSSAKVIGEEDDDYYYEVQREYLEQNGFVTNSSSGEDELSVCSGIEDVILNLETLKEYKARMKKNGHCRHKRADVENDNGKSFDDDDDDDDYDDSGDDDSSYYPESDDNSADLGYVRNRRNRNNNNNGSEKEIEEGLSQNTNKDDSTIESSISNCSYDNDMCINCKRQSVFEGDADDYMNAPDYFDIILVGREGLHWNRKWSNIKKAQCSLQQLPLCTQCKEYLTNAGEKVKDISIECQFPSYLWKIFKNVLRNSERLILWKIIPKRWRLWWVNSIHFNVMVIGVQPICVEITKNIRDFKLQIETNNLVKINNALKGLMPTVLCAWGCTEYKHCCGFIEMDVLLAHKMQHVDLPLLSDIKLFRKVKSSRLDFFQDNATDYENLMLCEDWRALPSIIWFSGRGPCFATCRHHDCGTELEYFHVPRFPRSLRLPAQCVDQLAHCVIKPRLLWSIKCSVNNTSYETVEMRGCYSGIDTCNLAEFGNFNFCSYLTE